MKGSELRIKAKNNSLGTVQLIPHEKLVGDFPTLFVKEYAHWLHLRSGVVEFRPLTDQWKNCNENWSLQLNNTNTSSILPARISAKNRHGLTFLCDIRSPTVAMFSGQLRALEVPGYIHIHFAPTKTPEVMAELPRYRLSFVINAAHKIECQSISNMVIDERQSVGTLIGLRNQLVLRARNEQVPRFSHSRLVLIPHGTLTFSDNAHHHTSVEVKNDGDRWISYHQYWVDHTLGRLTSTADLHSRLYKIHLHAVTSHCLPDPLTGRTGTEEALDELACGASMSFQTMTSDNAKRLQEIACLTPKHEYYPKGMRCMQTVYWSSLPPLAQHYGFHALTQSILKYACSVEVFQGPAGADLKQLLAPRHELLQSRAAQRLNKLYPHDVLPSLPTLSFHCSDVDYVSRDRNPDSATQDENAAFWASSLVGRQLARPTYVSLDLLSVLEQWKHIKGPSDQLTLTYNSAWLTAPDLPDQWLSLYNICRLHHNKTIRYKMAFTLSSMAFANEDLRGLVPVLVAFATHTNLQQVSPPECDFYDLSDGYDPEKATVQKHVLDAAYSFEESPSDRLTRDPYETDDAFRLRQIIDFDDNKKKIAEQLTESIMVCLGSQSYLSSSDVSGHFWEWYDLAACLMKVNAYVASCSNNRQLREHMRCVQSVIGASSSPLGVTMSSAEVSMRFSPAMRRGHQSGNIVNLSNLLCYPNFPVVEKQLPVSPPEGGLRQTVLLTNMTSLGDLLADLYNHTQQPVRHHFGTDLKDSYNDLLLQHPPKGIGCLPHLTALEGYRQQCKHYMGRVYNSIKTTLRPSPSQLADSVLEISGLWPRLTRRTLLSRLSYVYRGALTPSAKETLVAQARAVLSYQHSQRLLEAAVHCQVEDFFKELDNTYLTHGLTDADLDELLIEV
jgi:hypothetical protein